MAILVIGICFLVVGVGEESSLVLKPGWVKESEFPSPYATQAACADEKFAYAISNTTVAVHDRFTGKLLSKSEGQAKHLNSGFLRHGKVYCAHSNFPSLPEESEVKVYDPSTNRLTTFHRFERPPGSLVWNVYEEGHWWCCFAHYGPTNDQTLLVRMNDKFEEQARWKFPKKVVDDWDKMSASGGIWDGRTLLVSHHHFKVLYRLRLPRQGTELEFVEALAAPFPGQGIAREPVVANRLVGIDRKSRSILFATKNAAP